MGKKKKKKTKRDQSKHPNLVKRLNRRVVQEYIDYDYIDDLDEEAKSWLNDFTGEYYNASVGAQGDEGKNNRFHKSRELVKERQDANNKRNADLYGDVANKVGATKLHTYSDGLSDVQSEMGKKNLRTKVENVIIAKLDNYEEIKRQEKLADKFLKKKCGKDRIPLKRNKTKRLKKSSNKSKNTK